MKKIILIILILIPTSILGQKWSPIGAEWYYDVTYAFDRSIDYHKVYCDSIIKIKNINCRRINIDYGACNNHFRNKIYTYDHNDTVYFYNTDIDSFEILYNFNSVKGDSWIISTKYPDKPRDTIVVVVDSVDYIGINAHNLKRLYVTYNHLNFYAKGDTYKTKSTIVQVLGDTKLLINITDRLIGVCDMNFLLSLRCYNDSILGFYTTGLRDSCSYKYDWLSIDSLQQSNDLTIYPNPTKGIIMISNQNYKIINYELIDIQGLVLKRGRDNKIDLSSFKVGIYFLRLTINNNRSKVLKLVKHLP
jgi:hypothetical protein